MMAPDTNEKEDQPIKTWRKDCNKRREIRVIQTAGDGPACSRVLSWQPDVVEIAVWSPEIEDIEFLMLNKLSLGDRDAYQYNAKRLTRAFGELVDRGLEDLADAERGKHLQMMNYSYGIGAFAVIFSPLTTLWLIIPAVLTLLVIEWLNWRLKQRLTNIESFRCRTAMGRKNSIKISTPHPVPPDTDSNTKGGRDA